MSPMTENDKPIAVAQICRLLLEGELMAAKQTARTSLPFEPVPKKQRRKKSKENQQAGATSDVLPIGIQPAKRRVSERTRLSVWLRDGYKCRYTNARLVLPPVLELLSLLLPAELPYDNPPHGRYALTHIVMWELWPAVDHVRPVSRSQNTASANALENLVTTSAIRNSEKSASELTALGWELLAPSPTSDWDGLAKWYVQYLTRDESLFEHPTSGKRLMRWYRLLMRASAV